MAKDQYLHAVGKRKTAVARITLKPGTGQFIINKRPVEQYLPREADRYWGVQFRYNVGGER